MATVELNLPHHRYEVQIGPGLLSSLGESVKAVAPHRRAAMLADRNLLDTHARIAARSLEAVGYDLTLHPVDAGEDHKNLDTIREAYDVLLEARLERRSPIIAVGGGVVGDMAGFIAATYLRGVPFVQCPTTLLAMVDASVGGKTGVNVPQGKNLVGAFYQPVAVVIDTDTLETLPARELRCGLAECVKHGLIRDASLFDWIESNADAILALDSAALVELVHRNVRIKAAVVMADEKEAGQRAHLNFGHTFAHAIEATQTYGDIEGYMHGEAVALGMVAATRLAIDRGQCPPEVLERLIRLLERLGLPTRAKRLAPTDRLIETMRLDKKVADDRIRLVLPERLGSVSIVNDATDAQIAVAWDCLR